MSKKPSEREICDCPICGRAHWKLGNPPRDAAAGSAPAMREAAAKVAREGCLVPPDGGSPTEAEAEMCERIATAIRALPVAPDPRDATIATLRKALAAARGALGSVARLAECGHLYICTERGQFAMAITPDVPHRARSAIAAIDAAEKDGDWAGAHDGSKEGMKQL